jgi:hypothetical protein
MSFGVIFGVVLGVLVIVVVVSVVRGRPKQPPHAPGSLVRSYRRYGRGSQVNARIRANRPRRRR